MATALPIAAYERVNELWRDPTTGRVYGDGVCEWCGARLYVARARWFDNGYILECGSRDCH